MIINNGKFVISIDFELMWGVWDKMSAEEYGENIKGVHNVIPRLLEAFRKHKVKATFATVGFLFFETKEELLKNLPDKLPAYNNKKLSPYESYIRSIGRDAKEDPFHYAPELIKNILDYPEQELSTHTFCHYYCLEHGQTVDAFKADILNAQRIAHNKYNRQLTSLVFPRNQFNNEYLEVCNEVGIICIRGNEHSWLYEARNTETESHFRRALRLIDSYINISGHNCYSDKYLKSKFPIDIPASRFLRPYSPRLKPLNGMKLKRIKSGMTYAAKNNFTYHLWWHPHNFGIYQNENFSFLEEILNHYDKLNKEYNFQSYTMTALAKEILKDDH